MRAIFAAWMAVVLAAGTAAAADRPLIDVHIHYSHDAWQMLPPERAVATLREAGLRKAFVSSSSDEGTQKLYRVAPDLVVPVLRPYRSRGETGSWLHDETVIDMVAGLLDRNVYAGIGEFHVFGADADLPVMRAMVRLARQHRIFLHLHGDAEAVEHVFAQDPEARVLWAHSGFTTPDAVRAMLARYPRLLADLAYRNDHHLYAEVDPTWRQLFLDYPDRFMVGTDTYTPERWIYVVDHADSARQWLDAMPPEVADRIAFGNAEALAKWALGE